MRVSVQEPPAQHDPTAARLYRWRWVVWGALILLSVGIGVSLALLRSPAKSAAKTVPPDRGFTWAAGEKRAPELSLVDENGRPISLGAFHGRPVLLTFIDPVCRRLCPREARP